MRISKLVLIYLALLSLDVNASSAEYKQAIIFKGFAKLVVKNEKVEEFKLAVQKIIRPTINEEKNISYEAYQVFNDDGEPTNVFVFHELWKTKEAMLVDHKENSAHMKAFFKKIAIGTPHSWVESFEVNGENVRPLN